MSEAMTLVERVIVGIWAKAQKEDSADGWLAAAHAYSGAGRLAVEQGADAATQDFLLWAECLAWGRRTRAVMQELATALERQRAGEVKAA